MHLQLLLLGAFVHDAPALENGSVGAAAPVRDARGVGAADGSAISRDALAESAPTHPGDALQDGVSVLRGAQEECDPGSDMAGTRTREKGLLISV